MRAVSAVRPEFGPTLPEVLGPWLERLSRPWRVVLATVAGAVVLAALWGAFLRPGDEHHVVIRDPITFNLIHEDGLRRVAAVAPEVLRLQGRGTSFTVSPLALPAYRGETTGILPTYVEGLVPDMERRYPGFLRRYEGRANINKQQGYELVFQFRDGRKTRYGRRVLLLPTLTSREGVDILMLADRTPAIPRADAVGRNGLLKLPLRSFRFGTDRP